MTLKLNFMKGLGYMQPLEYLQMVEYLCNLLSEHSENHPNLMQHIFSNGWQNTTKRYCSLSMQLAWWVWIVAGHFFHFNHRMGKKHVTVWPYVWSKQGVRNIFIKDVWGKVSAIKSRHLFFDLMLYWCTWQWFMQSALSKPCFAGFSLLSWRWTIQKGATKMRLHFLGWSEDDTNAWT